MLIGNKSLIHSVNTSLTSRARIERCVWGEVWGAQRRLRGHWERKRKGGYLGAYAIKRVATGVHLPNPRLCEPARLLRDRADYCLGKHWERTKIKWYFRVILLPFHNKKNNHHGSGRGCNFECASSDTTSQGCQYRVLCIILFTILAGTRNEWRVKCDRGTGSAASVSPWKQRGWTRIMTWEEKSFSERERVSGNTVEMKRE